jgi:D-methionine transport system permease protein
MYTNWSELLRHALLETLEMSVAAGALALVAGLPLGLALAVTAPGGILQLRWLYRTLSVVVDAFRAVPFVVVLVALIPLTQWVAGTSIGTEAAIIPLAIGATPYYARIAEVALRGVEPGTVAAVQSMGAGRWTVVREVLLPEALPGLVAGFTVTFVTIIGASAMAGTLGAGGLGGLAIEYGYRNFNPGIMLGIVMILVVLVGLVQSGGARLARLFERG